MTAESGMTARTAGVAAQAARMGYVEYPGAGHFLTPELDAESCQAMVAWLQRWLP